MLFQPRRKRAIDSGVWQVTDRETKTNVRSLFLHPLFLLSVILGVRCQFCSDQSCCHVARSVPAIRHLGHRACLLCYLPPWNQYYHYNLSCLEIVSQTDQSSGLLCLLGQPHDQYRNYGFSVGHPGRYEQLFVSIPSIHDPMVSRCNTLFIVVFFAFEP